MLYVTTNIKKWDYYSIMGYDETMLFLMEYYPDDYTFLPQIEIIEIIIRHF